MSKLTLATCKLVSYWFYKMRFMPYGDGAHILIRQLDMLICQLVASSPSAPLPLAGEGSCGRKWQHV